ncbi:AAA family ATPase [Pedococcus bigeumensis]|uniref:AAA family ATPase n=1 Tax=Pedococcus bigeumensis TaxID=433644 RepID=UPI002FE91532
MTSENTDDLAYEAATNRRYLTALEARLSRAVPIALAANEKWVGHTPRSGLSYDQLGPLVARVGLDVQDEHLGASFYVGARWLSDFDHAVVSWDAPVAKVFYEPDVDSHEIARHVVVRRTLLERRNDIVKVYDEWLANTSRDAAPFARRRLDVPAAPVPSGRRAKRREAAKGTDASTPADPAGSHESSPRTFETSVMMPTGPARTEETLRRGMRSVEAVDYALRAPRAAALTSVLATLQPDQYRLVTRSAAEPLVVQGHPGTGKTIVAIHRAAYLVSPERPTDERVDRLLLLGPTDEWVRHVDDIVKTLDIERRVSVKSIPAWFREIAQINHALSGELDGSVTDVGQFIKNLFDRGARACREDQPWATGPGARMKNLERLYDYVRGGGTIASPLKLGEISGPWVKTLPTFGAAIRRRRYLPLFAQASLSIMGQPVRRFGHIVVDEAQDVAGLEWEIIRAHNGANGWTLVGDMNQRRHDFGATSWSQVLDRLSAGSDTTRVTTHVIERGYRSTQPILDFAKALLPRSERSAQSLQQAGPAPKVTRASRSAERDPLAIREAERLLAAYPGGTVAVIAVEQRSLEQSLLSAGWRRSERQGDWQKEGRLLALRDAEAARGVEFDAVVVVEPGAFPRNLARVGPLYTSLTRANRELAVVHHQALPDELRRHSRHH